MTQAYPSEQVSADDILWRNSIIGQERDIRLPLGDEAYQLRFLPAEGVTASQLAVLSAGDVRIAVSIDSFGKLPHVSRFVDGAELSALSPEMLPTILEAIFEKLLDALGQAAGGACQLSGVADGPTVSGLDRKLVFQVSSGEDAICSGLVQANEAGIGLIEKLVAQAPRVSTVSADQLSVIGNVTIGMTQMDIVTLNKLQLHDVVIIAITGYQQDQAAMVQFAQNVTWKVIAGDQDVTLSEPVASNPLAVAPTDGISVNLVFDTGQVMVPAEQLTSLAAGTALPFSRQEQVTLRVGQQPIATGELVSIGDRLGVRLLQPPRHFDVPT